jgi:hypothetical protein
MCHHGVHARILHDCLLLTLSLLARLPMIAPVMIKEPFDYPKSFELQLSVVEVAD